MEKETLIQEDIEIAIETALQIAIEVAVQNKPKQNEMRIGSAIRMKYE